MMLNDYPQVVQKVLLLEPEELTMEELLQSMQILKERVQQAQNGTVQANGNSHGMTNRYVQPNGSVNHIRLAQEKDATSYPKPHTKRMKPCD